MVFSFEKRLLIDSKKKIYSLVIMRVVILWLLGMVVQGNLLALDGRHHWCTLARMRFLYLFFGMFFNSRSFVTQFLFGFQRFVGDYSPLLISAAAVVLVWAICYLIYKKKMCIKI